MSRLWWPGNTRLTHKYYPEFYAHAAELDWLNGAFPLSRETVQGMVLPA